MLLDEGGQVRAACGEVKRRSRPARRAAPTEDVQRPDLRALVSAPPATSLARALRRVLGSSVGPRSAVSLMTFLENAARAGPRGRPARAGARHGATRGTRSRSRGGAGPAERTGRSHPRAAPRSAGRPRWPPPPPTPPPPAAEAAQAAPLLRLRRARAQLGLLRHRPCRLRARCQSPCSPARRRRFRLARSRDVGR
jgi:hypothetical protein